MSDKGVVNYIPSGLGHYALTNGVENKLQIHAVLVLGNRIKPVYVDAEELAEHFKHGYVELCILITHTDEVGLFLHLSDDINRHQYKRCITSLIALFCLIPAQEAQRQIYGVYAVFLNAHLSLSVELLHYLFKVAVLDEGTEPVTLELRLGYGGYKVAVIFYLEYLAVCECKCSIIGHRHHLEVLALGYLVLQNAKITYHELYAHCRGTEVEQAVS